MWVAALKVDVKAVYQSAAAGRLGLADWQGQIDAKLRSVSEIYRVFQDQAQYARSEFLEIVIIVLIAIEAVIGILEPDHFHVATNRAVFAEVIEHVNLGIPFPMWSLRRELRHLGQRTARIVSENRIRTNER